jgi:hypothetical protein
MEPQALVLARAVRWCGNLAGWFPQLRPGPGALAFAEDVAARLGPNDGEVPAEDVGAALDLIDDGERRGLVHCFATEQADQWAAVCADSGGVAALEDALVAGAVRAAILERRLPPASRLADLETGRAPTHSAREVLAVTLPPEAVWSIVDVQEAELALTHADSEEAWRRTGIEIATERGSDVHSLRVRTLAAVLRRQLPLIDFPRASALLEDAYARAVDEPGFDSLVAGKLLPVYVAQRASYITSMN